MFVEICGGEASQLHGMLLRIELMLDSMALTPTGGLVSDAAGVVSLARCCYQSWQIGHLPFRILRREILLTASITS